MWVRNKELEQSRIECKASPTRGVGNGVNRNTLVASHRNACACIPHAPVFLGYCKDMSAALNPCNEPKSLRCMDELAARSMIGVSACLSVSWLYVASS